ncbi:feruloyl esterase [Plectosphaerella plurivora]|uniref:Carboxylic ester hydrolase n=1 Tax=Plectosphaerella plurivora TaxID=936078 RepID=A0A9P8V3A7_9PEZI|nr:feruloyl esterase [Plectosphaerella plurivora]
MSFLTTSLLGSLALYRAVQASSSCNNLQLPNFKDFDLLSLQAIEVPATSPASVAFCNITATLTHPGDDDFVIATVWLPAKSSWNGRFIALGGGGLNAEASASTMQPSVAQGWAAGSTDAGLSLNRTISSGTGTWALRDGEINWPLITNFAHRSMHDMTVIAKAAAKAYYGKKASYSYYSGCSTGGRQGYFAAQYHPEDFDGIVANAPALHTPRVSPGTFWPSVVMGNIAAPPQCVFQAYFDAILEQCDPLDGVVDGLISRPEKCKFKPNSLKGKTIDCNETGSSVTIAEEYVTVVEKVLEGFTSSSGESWYGLPPGAPFNGIANVRTVNGTTVPVPFGAGESWMRYFVAAHPSLDTASLTFEEFDELFDRSVELHTPILGTTKPDLTKFRKAGGKLLTWHGLGDPLLTHEGTVEYWRSLQRTMKGSLEDFYRVFLAPGVAHCGGGYGPLPSDPLAVLIDWVEKRNAPKTLFAQSTINGRTIARNLCRYPEVLTYKGKGDINSAESFTCKSCRGPG